MLVLSRKESETIKIGDSIEITLVRVSGDRVRVGVQAPADMLILRGELERQTTNEKSSVQISAA